MHRPRVTARLPWHAALIEGLPIFVGYGAVGLAFGMVAVESGLSPLAAVVLSAAVYAGVAQFLAVELLAAGSSPLLIAGLIALVNARLVLFTAMLAPRFQFLPPVQKMLVAHAATDETVLVGVQRSPDHRSDRLAFFTVLLAAAYGTWLTATAVGAAAAGRMTVPGAAAFALPALLAAVLTLSIGKASHLLAALAAGTAAVLLQDVLPPGLWVLMAGSTGLAAAWVYDDWWAGGAREGAGRGDAK